MVLAGPIFNTLKRIWYSDLLLYLSNSKKTINVASTLKSELKHLLLIFKRTAFFRKSTCFLLLNIFQQRSYKILNMSFFLVKTIFKKRICHFLENVVLLKIGNKCSNSNYYIDTTYFIVLHSIIIDWVNKSGYYIFLNTD